MRFAIRNETFREHHFAGTCAEASRNGHAGNLKSPPSPSEIRILTPAEAERYGSIVRDHGLETVGHSETNFINTAAAGTIAFPEKTDSPDVLLHLDVKAMSSDTGAIPEIVRESLPWTAHFHANDPNLQGPGMGQLDLPPITAELIKGACDKWGSAEVCDTNLSPETLASESRKNLKTAFA